MKQFSILIFCLLSIYSLAQQSSVMYQDTTSFYPDIEILNTEDIDWGIFTVPEDWDAPEGRKIELAVAILKSHSDTKDSNPIIMLDGGPGGGSIEGIWWFLNHPLRDKHDIYLIDARGTGFSSPRLCPDLGDKFMKILSKNHNPAEDEEAKVLAAMACKQHLISQGINVKAYHSKNIAKDLHAAKEYFNYSSWNVYSVSYGTYVAQVYANEFPKDVKTLILDSPISDLTDYYTSNTSNYISSLSKVFSDCKEDPDCNKEYPNLEETYYSVIAELDNTPITVKVDKSVIDNEEFTYNAEDFKIAIHQALYQKDLIEVLPLLILQFHERNEDALSALVAAFSGALGLDYGMYYCVSCTETIPMNSIDDYHTDANKYPKLKGGLSFYNSDFAVCDKWNMGNDTTQNEEYFISQNNIPTLIFTGKYDPITPQRNGDSLSIRIENSSLISAANLGHASSFSYHGFKMTNKFINEPSKRLSTSDLESNNDINYVRDIFVSGGVTNLGNSINDFDPIFFAPLVIALLILIIAIVIFTISLIKRRKEKDWLNKINKFLLITCSLSGLGVLISLILGLLETSAINFYILAVGIPEQWSYLFSLLLVFVVLLILSSIYFVFNMNKIENRSLIFTVLFSNILLGCYFFYWGFLF